MIAVKVSVTRLRQPINIAPKTEIQPYREFCVFTSASYNSTELWCIFKKIKAEKRLLF